ncbi:hypothetical protein [Micromonospora pisi]|uniref:hypothetical protein n=1 Tax=Micromonospora pisi TaxID=589240 RepID=UPI000EAC3F7C|nr:hypothetical protein [Micromonospora pisi]
MRVWAAQPDADTDEWSHEVDIDPDVREECCCSAPAVGRPAAVLEARTVVVLLIDRRVIRAPPGERWNNRVQRREGTPDESDLLTSSG